MNRMPLTLPLEVPSEGKVYIVEYPTSLAIKSNAFGKANICTVKIDDSLDMYAMFVTHPEGVTIKFFGDEKNSLKVMESFPKHWPIVNALFRTGIFPYYEVDSLKEVLDFFDEKVYPFTDNR